MQFAGAAALSAALSGAGCGLIARRGWIDTPGDRSSHARPTRTGGGVAIALAVLVASAIPGPALGVWAAWRLCGVPLAGAFAMALLGAADDHAGAGARAKLALGGGVALVVALLLPPVRAIPIWPGAALPLWAPIGVAGGVLWLVTAMNAVNFVDGANGFAPGGLVVAFAALAAGGLVGGDVATAALAGLAAAAYAGFLPWNLAGRLFQGDSGSLFGGFLFAALQLAAASRGALPLLFGPLVLLPWLTDVLLTLLRRARGGRALLEAHREHLYQRWLQATGRGHLALAARNALVCAGAALAAITAAWAPAWQGPIFAAALLACVCGWCAVSRRLDAALVRT